MSTTRNQTKLLITTGRAAAGVASTVPHADDATQIRTLAIAAARALDEKKADEVVVLDVAEHLVVTDLFVIASASNKRLVASLADEAEQAVKAAGGPGPVASEGIDEANWVLLDFGGFVVHLFLDETRRYYDLEHLFNDAARVDWQA